MEVHTVVNVIAPTTPYSFPMKEQTAFSAELRNRTEASPIKNSKYIESDDREMEEVLVSAATPENPTKISSRLGGGPELHPYYVIIEWSESGSTTRRF